MADSPAPSARRSRRGFTLVELLVAIAIITILAGLLFPVLAASRESARAAACVSNLRQLHAAYQLYAADHNGSVPPYLNRIGIGYGKQEGQPTTPIPERGEQLVGSLWPYLRSEAVWFCPADPYKRTDSQVGFVRHRYSSYVVDQLSSWLGPLELGEAAAPITMDGPVYADGEPHPERNQLLTDNLWPCPARAGDSPPDYSHGERFNYLFFDGHVKSYRRESPECPW